MFLLERIRLLRKVYLELPSNTHVDSEQFSSVLHWSQLLERKSLNTHLDIKWKTLLNQVESEAEDDSPVNTIVQNKVSEQFIIYNFLALNSICYDVHVYDFFFRSLGIPTEDSIMKVEESSSPVFQFLT